MSVKALLYDQKSSWFITGFSGNVENIGRHFTPMEQVYSEIDLHNAILVGQINTRINLIKNNSSKRVHFSDDEENHSGQKYVDDL